MSKILSKTFVKILFLLICIPLFAQVKYNDLGSNDNVITNIPKVITFDQVAATNLFTFSSNHSITNVVPVSKSSVSNTVYQFWVGYEGEYISETNSTGGTIDGKMYFIRKQL